MSGEPLYSETIPCYRCGKVGESILMLGRWVCGACITELVTESVESEKDHKVATKEESK